MNIKPFSETTYTDESISDPLSTFIGTMLESTADEMSFGIFKPDIIPQNQEEIDKYSAMAGHIAGNLAGFIPSIALSGGAVNLALRGFTFGRKLIIASETIAKAGKAAPSILRGTAGIFNTGSAFAVHDVVREFISQTENNDPDLANLGKTAATGFLTGSVFGFTHGVTKFTHPINQITWGGVSMATANAIGLAEEGEDITKENMVTSFLMGAMLSGIQARGWKQKKVAANEVIGKSTEQMMKENLDPTSDKRKLFEKYAGVKIENLDSPLKENVEKHFKSIEYQWTGEKGKPLPKDKIPSTMSRYEKEQYAKSRQMPSPVKSFQDILGIGDKELQDFGVSGFEISEKGIAKTTAGKRQKLMSETAWRTKPLTEKQKVDIITEIKEYEKESFKDVIDINVDKADIPNTKLMGMGWFTPPDVILRRANATDLVEPATARKQLSDLHKKELIAHVNSLYSIIESEENIALKEKLIGFMKNKPTSIDEKIYTTLTTKDKREFNTALMGFTEKGKTAIKGLRSITDYLYTRHNQTRKVLNEPPIPYRDAYVRRLIDYEASKEMGFTFEQPTPKFKKETKMPATVYEPTAFPVVTPEAPVSHDIRKAFANGINADIKFIYLSEPIKILNAKTDALLKAGKITPETARTIAEYANTFLLEIPNMNTIKQNNALKGMMDATHFTDGLDMILENFGRKVSDRPLDAVARVYGQGVTLGMMGLRPALAIRDRFQSLFTFGYASVKSLAKAMTTKEMPAIYNDLKKQSPILSTMMQDVIEEGVTTGGMGKLIPQTVSAISNVEFSAKVAFFQTAEYIQKGWGNWADNVGKELRKASGNKWVFSEKEKGYLLKEMEHIPNHSQFLYHITGMPGIARNPLGKIATKFQSFLFNYTTKYIPDLINRTITGHPVWDKSQTLQLPWSQRIGIFKHLASMALMVAAAERAGFDLSTIAPVSYSFKDDDKPWYKKFKSGIVDFRPSPGMSLLTNLSSLMSGSDTKRAIAKRELATLIPAMTVPGFLAGRDVRGAIEEGDMMRILAKRPYEKEVKFEPLTFPKRHRRSSSTSPFGRSIFSE